MFEILEIPPRLTADQDISPSHLQSHVDHRSIGGAHLKIVAYCVRKPPRCSYICDIANSFRWSWAV